MKKTARFQVLQFVMDYKDSHNGNSPSIREIQDGVGLNSTSVTHFHLAVLQRDGIIVRAGRALSRNIVIVDLEAALAYIEDGKAKIKTPRPKKNLITFQPSRTQRGRRTLGLDAHTLANIERVVARAKANEDVGRDVIHDDGRVVFHGSKVS